MHVLKWVLKKQRQTEINLSFPGWYFTPSNIFCIRHQTHYITFSLAQFLPLGSTSLSVWYETRYRIVISYTCVGWKEYLLRISASKSWPFCSPCVLKGAKPLMACWRKSAIVMKALIFYKDHYSTIGVKCNYCKWCWSVPAFEMFLVQQSGMGFNFFYYFFCQVISNHIKTKKHFCMVTFQALQDGMNKTVLESFVYLVLLIANSTTQ